MSALPKITEEMGVHKAWFEEARHVRGTDALAAFVDRIMNGYEHDYGTVCHAMAACAVAACWCANNERGACGGITGFQSGAVFREFFRHWQGCDGPARMLRYEHLLFPQYAHRFERTISRDTWEWVQAEARKKIAAVAPDDPIALNVLDHWKSIVAGEVPFGFTVTDGAT